MSETPQPLPEDAGLPAPKLMTVRQTAEFLNVSQSLVYQLVDRGRLACHRIGAGRGTIRISREDVDAFLANCREAPEQPKAKALVSRLRHLQL